MSTHKLLERCLPCLPLLLAALTLAAPLLISGQALYWGTPALQFVPWRELAFETVREGQVPLWNPWVGMGTPLLANYQTALFYPPTWVLFILSSVGGIEWHAWGQMLLVAFHWILSGIGMARLARRLGLGSFPQSLAALVYGLGAYQIARAGFLSINAALAWLPWIIDTAGALASPRLRGNQCPAALFVRLSLFAGLSLLAGHAQTVWYTLLLGIFWSAFWAWLDAGPGGSPPGTRAGVFLRLRRLMSAGLVLGAGYLLASGLAAVQLLPTLEYLGQSQRAGAVDYDFAMTYSFWPWRLLTLLAPALFGSPVSGDYWGYANYWEDALYIGLLPLLLGLGAALGWLVSRLRHKPYPAPAPGEREQRAARYEVIPFLLVLALAAFILALGKNTPVFPWVYRFLPTFDMFQAPTRITLWAVFALSLLAAFGAASWRRPTGRALYWTRLATAGAAAVTIGASLAWALMGDVSPTFIRATALAGLWGLGAGVLSLLAPKVGEDGLGGTAAAPWHWAAALFLALDLVVAGWGLNPGVEAGFYSQPVPGVDALKQALDGRRIYLSSDDEYAIKYERFLRFDAFESGEDPFLMRAVLLPNLNMLDKVPSMSNFDPLVPGRYTRWMEALGEAQGATLEKLLDLSGAGVQQRIDPNVPGGVDFDELRAGMGRRARWIACAVPAASGTDALQRLLSAKIDAASVVLIEPGPGEVLSACDEIEASGQVVLLEESPGPLVYRVDASASGWLLLSDTWYPGWQALVNGVEHPIHRANYLFRAVRLEAGESDVVFSYRPRIFLYGAYISLTALIVWVTLIITHRRRAV